MTAEQIIRMARDAGMTGEMSDNVLQFLRNLLEAERERLHDNLMAMHEREKHNHNYWHFAARHIKENA